MYEIEKESGVDKGQNNMLTSLQCMTRKEYNVFLGRTLFDMYMLLSRY